MGSRAVDGNRFLESNLLRFQEPILGYVKVPRIDEAFDSRNLLPLTALDPEFEKKLNTRYQIS